MNQNGSSIGGYNGTVAKGVYGKRAHGLGMADLKGRVALVTGANRGVGRGIAEGLAEASATIYLTGPASSSLEASALAVATLGGQPFAFALDHSDDDAVAALFRRIEAESGRLDLLVNSVRPGSRTAARRVRFWEAPLSAWDDQAAAGLRGYYVTAALGARLMVEQGSGLIVHVSSADAGGDAVETVNGVAGAGTDRMARDMARELVPHGVAALALVPGSGLPSPRYVGRSVAALAMDPDIMEKSGGSYQLDELAREYRFTEPGLELA